MFFHLKSVVLGGESLLSSHLCSSRGNQYSPKPWCEWEAENRKKSVHLRAQGRHCCMLPMSFTIGVLNYQVEFNCTYWWRHLAVLFANIIWHIPDPTQPHMQLHNVMNILVLGNLWCIAWVDKRGIPMWKDRNYENICFQGPAHDDLKRSWRARRSPKALLTQQRLITFQGFQPNLYVHLPSRSNLSMSTTSNASVHAWGGFWPSSIEIQVFPTTYMLTFFHFFFSLFI